VIFRYGPSVFLVVFHTVVDSWGFRGGVAEAVVKPRVVTTGDSESASQDIVNVLAVVFCVGSIFASSDTEVVGTRETRPLVQLLVLPREGIGEYQTALGVSEACPGVRIKFTTIITRHQPDFCQITLSRDLHIRDLVAGNFDEMRGGDGSRRHDTGSVAFFEAVTHRNLLNMPYTQRPPFRTSRFCRWAP